MNEPKKSTRKLKTHCKQGHELSDDNLVKRLLPTRKCLTCYAAAPHYNRVIYSGFEEWE